MWKQVLGRDSELEVDHGTYVITQQNIYEPSGNKAFSLSNYSLFSISQGTRAWIISLGIRKQATKQLYKAF